MGAFAFMKATYFLAGALSHKSVEKVPHSDLRPGSIEESDRRLNRKNIERWRICKLID